MLNRGSDVCFIVEEDYINTLFYQVFQQRPSLFNYGTANYVYGYLPLCTGIDFAFRPYYTVETPIPIPGTGGKVGLDFVLNIRPPEIDFDPIQTPLPKPVVGTQRFVLSGSGTLGMPPLDGKKNTLPGVPEYSDDPNNEKPVPFPIAVPGEPGTPSICWDFAFHVVGYFEEKNANGVRSLVPRADNVLLESVAPPDLSALLENCILATLRYGLLRKMHIRLGVMTMDIGELGSLHLSLTPTGGPLANNPDISRDRLSVYLNVEAGP